MIKIINISNWDNKEIIKMRENILSDMNLWIKDMEFIKGCGEKCKGPLCIYQDIDNDNELPTFVKIFEKTMQK